MDSEEKRGLGPSGHEIDLLRPVREGILGVVTANQRKGLVPVRQSEDRRGGLMSGEAGRVCQDHNKYTTRSHCLCVNTNEIGSEGIFILTSIIGHHTTWLFLLSVERKLRLHVLFKHISHPSLPD